ncbi:MAG: class IV adenylate cyclase [Candidatus Micrarchaeales archaeon]|jgi:adenylate cyclase class 2|uniref:Adenylyl cyclase CyaB n=1 Tax=Candidatus Micrarchaeum acidiphilum ARMAN-2 TaxID=425595 RepID=C7DIJ4_MICA2|nr:MAG: adenylyl cyclase CyaB [Candidatus Micrarchaeum acidiphilum ARMAN-2]MCW6161023.1 class IV adenylate cyclase [Candidatus Micrarchaeales archaeon]
MEQEIRLIVNDFKDVKNRIVSAGAVLESSKTQYDTYYGSIRAMRALGKSFILRVRKSGSSNFLTFKGATGKEGYYEEYETRIANGKSAAKIIERSGFEKIIFVKKHRELYRYKNSTINLDSVDELGNFVEIEIISEKNADKRLNSIIKELRLEEYKSIRKGYVSLLLEKNGSKYHKYIKE